MKRRRETKSVQSFDRFMLFLVTFVELSGENKEKQKSL